MTSGRVNFRLGLFTGASRGTALTVSPVSKARSLRLKVSASGTKAVRKQKKEASQVSSEDKDQVTSESIFTTGRDRLSNLVQTLLFGAASRIERGTSVCVCCRGTGSMTCKECGGEGLSKAQSRSQGSKTKENEWMMSNRCRRCRGYGRYECQACDGLGKRYIAPLYED